MNPNERTSTNPDGVPEVPPLKASEFESVKAARRATDKKLEFFNSMMDATSGVKVPAPSGHILSPPSEEEATDGERWSIGRAADFLEWYAGYIREVKPDDLERHPYLPELDYVAGQMRDWFKLRQTPAGVGGTDGR